MVFVAQGGDVSELEILLVLVVVTVNHDKHVALVEVCAERVEIVAQEPEYAEIVL